VRHFDLTPFYRSTIGFDRLVDRLDAAGGLDADANGFPPYNIERLGENEYRISMAVAGFGETDVNIEVKETTLTVSGAQKAADKKADFLHHGIAGRSFERRFQLAEHVEVSGAKLKDGLLHIDLVRNLPERMKPRQISISTVEDTAPQLEAAE